MSVPSVTAPSWLIAFAPLVVAMLVGKLFGSKVQRKKLADVFGELLKEANFA